MKRAAWGEECHWSVGWKAGLAVVVVKAHGWCTAPHFAPARHDDCQESLFHTQGAHSAKCRLHCNYLP